MTHSFDTNNHFSNEKSYAVISQYSAKTRGKNISQIAEISVIMKIHCL